MSYYILKMLGTTGESILEFKENIKKMYIKKGPDVVEENIKVLDLSMDYLRELNTNLLTLNEGKNDSTSIYNEMLLRRGNLLKVSDFLKYKDGTFEGGTSSSDKRKISSLVPKWCKNNCINCNLCSFICPHGVIKSICINRKQS